ncbi:Integral membrane protein of the Golgi [Coemansia aciculifera]|uniref:Integral membrane protein of the Golgi n=1 Tax=Coemansia aciculifera TaxID=417176 RepID=A0A9W8M3A7_9FUNG|nr:Integral membrane protein of the Golgi [Coemansia aciculifera]KAJ2869832.1 Integral membrane protein of the Golgi [Coemansia aciculifera]
MVVARFLTDLQLSPQLLFDSRLVRGDTVDGWIIGIGLVCMGFANIIPLVYMVERSRLCIDFSLTFFTIHLLLTWWHQGWSPPLTLLWWTVIIGSGSVMAVGGRAACMRRELLPIAIRNFMPSHPRETPSTGRGDRDIDSEEMELETRVTNARDVTEVLFDGSHLEDHAGDAPKKRIKDDEDRDDDWGDSNWGEEDEVSDIVGPNAPAAAGTHGSKSTQQQQPQQQPAPAVTTTTTVPSSSSRPPVALKGGKRD